MIGYTYSIANDTLDGTISTTLLTTQINELSIAVALEHINTSMDILEIYFDSALSAGEKTALDTCLASHKDDPTIAHQTWEYQTLVNPTEQDLNDEGEIGWEVYAVDGNSYQMKRGTA